MQYVNSPKLDVGDASGFCHSLLSYLRRSPFGSTPSPTGKVVFSYIARIEGYRLLNGARWLLGYDFPPIRALQVYTVSLPFLSRFRPAHVNPYPKAKLVSIGLGWSAVENESASSNDMAFPCSIPELHWSWRFPAGHCHRRRSLAFCAA